MKKEKTDWTPIICLSMIALCFVAIIWLIYCGYTYDKDYGCKKLGYNKYISTFKACIDTDAKLHFVITNDDKLLSLNAFIPHYKPIYTELK